MGCRSVDCLDLVGSRDEARAPFWLTRCTVRIKKGSLDTLFMGYLIENINHSTLFQRGGGLFSHTEQLAFSRHLHTWWCISCEERVCSVRSQGVCVCGSSPQPLPAASRPTRARGSPARGARSCLSCHGKGRRAPVLTERRRSEAEVHVVVVVVETRPPAVAATASVLEVVPTTAIAATVAVAVAATVTVPV